MKAALLFCALSVASVLGMEENTVRVTQVAAELSEAAKAKDAEVAATAEKAEADMGNPVFLGGACNPTSWRQDTVMPLLKDTKVYYNPQVDGWSPALTGIEAEAKAKATVLFFVLSEKTRGFASIVEIAELVSTTKKENKELYVTFPAAVYSDADDAAKKIGGEKLGKKEAAEMNSALIFIASKLAPEQKFATVHHALLALFGKHEDFFKTETEPVVPPNAKNPFDTVPNPFDTVPAVGDAAKFSKTGDYAFDKEVDRGILKMAMASWQVGKGVRVTIPADFSFEEDEVVEMTEDDVTETVTVLPGAAKDVSRGWVYLKDAVTRSEQKALAVIKPKFDGVLDELKATVGGAAALTPVDPADPAALTVVTPRFKAVSNTAGLRTNALRRHLQ